KPPINSNQQTTAETNDNGNTSDDPIVCQHSFGEWNIVKEASCKEVGKRARSCNICEEVEEESISKSKTHTVVTDAAIPATCKSTGLTEGSHCSACNKVLVAQTVVPKTEDHTPVTDAAIPATCKNTGLTEGSHCSVCNKVLVAQTGVPKTEDHTPVTDAAIPATCKSTGLTEGSHCSVCNKILVAQTVVPKTEDHSSSNWIIDVEATCKSEGEKHKECTVCKIVLESEKIEKSMTHTALKNNVEMPSGSFCGDEGSCFVSVSCEVCGEMISSGYQDIPEKHSMANSACQVCGLPQSTTGLYFALNSDGKSYYAAPGRNFAGGDVVIGVYNNLSVTRVNFHHCDSLTSIVIGDCVERMGSFGLCFNLMSVTIGDRIKEIPQYAFQYCSNLSTIRFGDGVEKIGENAFFGCSSLYDAYISGSHDWRCGESKIYGKWIESPCFFADYLKQYTWEWYRE
ncbi:MAG: leucine-rich repeat domain-containing protein, partial [Ruminococcaceae bacterium]|nr:leucine-rich repeat domain-containing protein [Oscillospiraceae bacterium]